MEKTTPKNDENPDGSELEGAKEFPREDIIEFQTFIESRPVPDGPHFIVPEYVVPKEKEHLFKAGQSVAMQVSSLPESRHASTHGVSRVERKVIEDETRLVISGIKCYSDDGFQEKHYVNVKIIPQN